MDQSTAIDKRTFTCKECGYSAQVYGEQYLDFGCRNYIITFQCLECKILFEGIITKRKYQESLVVTHDLAEEVICLWCGKDKNRVWSRETGLCPKCNGEMNCSVNGQIKVDYKRKE
jgi:hypothetical protein